MCNKLSVWSNDFPFIFIYHTLSFCEYLIKDIASTLTETQGSYYDYYSSNNYSARIAATLAPWRHAAETAERLAQAKQASYGVVHKDRHYFFHVFDPSLPHVLDHRQLSDPPKKDVTIFQIPLPPSDKIANHKN